MDCDEGNEDWNRCHRGKSESVGVEVETPPKDWFSRHFLSRYEIRSRVLLLRRPTFRRHLTLLSRGQSNQPCCLLSLPLSGGAALAR